MTFVKDLNPEPLKSRSQSRKRVNSAVSLKIDDEVNLESSTYKNTAHGVNLL